MSGTAKKNKIRMNIVDLVIILLVLALLATAGYRVYEEVTKKVSSKQSNCILTFECTVASDSILDYLKNGDAVYLSNDGTLLGYLYDAVSNDGIGAVYKVVNDNSEASANSTVLLRGSIKLSIDAHKAQGNEYYILNDTNITEGGTLAVYTEMAVLNIVVKSMNESK